MSIDFYRIQWDKLPILFEMGGSIEQLFYSDSNSGVNSRSDWIQDVSNSVDTHIHSLQKKNEEHYCYNYNRENIKKNAPTIHCSFNFIVESIIGNNLTRAKVNTLFQITRMNTTI